MNKGEDMNEKTELSDSEPVAYLVEGSHQGNLYAKIAQFTVDEARNSAAEFARHYSTVTTTPLVRSASPSSKRTKEANESDLQSSGGAGGSGVVGTGAVPAIRRYYLNSENGHMVETQRGPWVRYVDVQSALASSSIKEDGPQKLWLWKNFVGGKPEYWAFDNPYPIHLTDGDPQTLGEPCGYAIFKPSRQGRTDVSEEQVLRAIAMVASIKEDGERAAIRYDVLQEIAATFSLDYNAVCRCVNVYVSQVSSSPPSPLGDTPDQQEKQR